MHAQSCSKINDLPGALCKSLVTHPVNHTLQAAVIACLKVSRHGACRYNQLWKISLQLKCNFDCTWLHVMEAIYIHDPNCTSKHNFLIVPISAMLEKAIYNNVHFCHLQHYELSHKKVWEQGLHLSLIPRP